MIVESIDVFYLSMPQVLDIGDGSQDTLLVRITGGGYVGWGECEASPLVSIASLVCPMSHSACKPVQASVLGQELGGVDDIARIGDLVRENSLDLLQADHTLSGIDTAMWDLLGRARGVPVYELLGYRCAFPKTPYASVLFGETPQETLEMARHMRRLGYRAGKFGWGAFGRDDLQADIDQVVAAREGLGEDGVLLIDAGTVWVDDVERASRRLPVLQDCRVTWLEEPFVSGALDAYRQLAAASGTVRLAGGEGSHNTYMAAHMIDHGSVGYIQIDAGRVGGITAAKQVADYAQAKGVTYVNHTFTSHLALSASLQAYAGVERDHLCEYPIASKPLAVELTQEHLLPDSAGQIRLPDAPGLGITPSPEAIVKYLVDVEIRVGGKTLYRTPDL
ncbi:MAG: mandelate racemase/muconate lactonizing enzyme family protein [Anaerolineae bacterium]|nr:mandelate racemase/muconate lactonizing enzyme family protein [Anaerolineae bacterium]